MSHPITSTRNKIKRNILKTTKQNNCVADDESNNKSNKQKNYDLELKINSNPEKKLTNLK